MDEHVDSLPDFSDRLQRPEVLHKLFELERELRVRLEEALIEKDGPMVAQGKKLDMGPDSMKRKVNDTNEVIEIYPAKHQGRQRRVDWKIRRTKEHKDPHQSQIIVEELNVEKFQHYQDGLVRGYRGLGIDEKGFLIRGPKQDVVGWMVVHEYNNGAAGLSFIGVNPSKESQHYGSEMLSYLKNKYSSISLTAVAYDTGDRGYENAQKRLYDFYARNGFGVISGWNWNKDWVNLEDQGGLSTDWKVVEDAFIANGVVGGQRDLLRFYLHSLDKENKLVETLGKDVAELSKSWMRAEGQLPDLEKRVDMDRFIDEYRERWQEDSALMTETHVW